jgi:tRNA(adenine34) deaminase
LIFFGKIGAKRSPHFNVQKKQITLYFLYAFSIIDRSVLPTFAPMLSVYSDTYFMQQALAEANKAYEAGEVPVGAVVVCEGRIIARAHNQTEQLTDVTAHAEILALTAASGHLGSKYLPDCTLFVTLEPCVMCAGALAWAQFGRVVYGASDEKRGFMLHGGKALLHPKTRLEMGIMEHECSQLMTSFFKEKR